MVMRLTMVVLLALIVAPVIASAEVVRGTVWNDGPLPGCTVTLTSPGESRTVIADSEGRYVFGDVLPGTYDLTVELSGFLTNTQRIVVTAPTVVPRVELALSPPTEAFTPSCSMTTCTDEGPRDQWDMPSCADEGLHDALIENIERGDRSALVLLRGRYEAANTYQERHRIGAVLLRHVSNDKAIWDDLFSNAQIAVRFPHNADRELPLELERYCAERNLDPQQLWDMSWNALTRIVGDPRSRGLFLEGLKTADLDLISLAIGAFAEQRDPSSLPAIKDALDRVAKDNLWLVDSLALFNLPEADEIAFRHLDEERRASYLEIRDSVNEPR